MTCYRKYTFTFSREDGHEHVLQKLEDACEDHWWFTEPVVTGKDEGVLRASIQVAARDQWWAHRRVMELIEAATWKFKTEVPVPVWETLPPHTNRGSYRG